MTRDLRLGLIGCGRVAQLGYVPAIGRARGVRLCCVADPVLSRCREVACSVPAYETAAALVAAGGIDAVVLATPCEAHLADATTAAEAGLAVLVEKPPAPDAAQARALARLEPAPWIGFNRRFDPGVQRLRAKVSPGEELDLDLASHHPSGWSSHVVADDILLANGSHLIDLARWLAGCDVEQVRATQVTHDVASVQLRFARGRADISCAWGRPHREHVEIRASAGSRRRRYVGEGGLWPSLRRRALGGRAGSDLAGLLARELEELARAVRGEAATTLATAADGAAVMAAIDAARRSAASGGTWLDVGPPAA